MDKNLCHGWQDRLGEEVSRAYQEASTIFEAEIESAKNAISSAGGQLNMAEAIAKIPVPGVPSV
ncbi:MAG: hypothetical protein J6038_01885 [Bacilli bacterium]|nr:hypothetical protein [Bacilli bacterium]